MHFKIMKGRGTESRLRAGARSLRMSLRFVIPLVLVLSFCAYAVVPLVDSLTLRWSVRDMDIRSRLIANTIHDPLAELLKVGAKGKVNALLLRTIQDERLLALAVCDPEGRVICRTPTYPKSLPISLADSEETLKTPLHQLAEGAVHVAMHPINYQGVRLGSLILVHDMSFFERRSADTRKFIIILFAGLGIVTSVITVLVAQLSWRGWMDGVRGMLHGEGIIKPFRHPAVAYELQPLVGDLKALLRTLDSERRFADDATITWTPESLRTLLHNQLAGERIIVVSNREPYIHVRSEEGIDVHRPASGLVTAVEPVMRACSGTWIAHGSGSADRESVDRNDRVRVPPDKPEYTLRRIWLSAEEESGYYYGFANEGLWPLCHIAHVRPVFRSSDWEQYVAINQRFADAVVREAESDDPVVLVQDYHFALLPGMVRRVLPKATIITFWHIPWPNPESFGICPWREELLRGLLGSTILGFHTPFHRKNFLETVDRYLETRIEHESSTISHGGQLTLVESYPISIQWPPPWRETQAPVELCRTEIRRALGLARECKIALGVDRQDYTKGILERFRAVEKLLELHPELVERFSLVQIAAPTRSALDDYQSFDRQVRKLAAGINQRFATESWQPVILKSEHHEPEVVNSYYRAADICMVTSLHDGMNLVAKEFVASRDDQQGVLLLSQFTGAAHELHEALIVNPYHIEQTARAMHRGLHMPSFEQRERMISMRALVRDFNVYRWAGRMLLDAARVRQREKLSNRIGRNV